MLRRIGTFLAGYPAALLVLSGIHLVAPRRRGWLAMSQLFGPHLFLGLVPLGVVSAVVPGRALRVGLAVAGVVGLARYGPRTRAGRRAIAASVPLEVLSWNVLADHRPAHDVVDGLLAHDASVVAIQELTTAVARAIVADPVLAARYPHRLLDPRDHDVLGMGVFSAYPLLDAGQAQRPPRQWATLDLGDGARLSLLNVHPVPPKIKVRRVFGLLVPVAYDPLARDHAIRRIRTLVDEHLRRGDRLIVVGDFNLSDREPAYDEIAAGLTDAQLAAGRWPGSTWQPRTLARLPLGMLRIDHLFAGPGVHPIAVSVDPDARGSDHHPIRASFEVARPPDG